MTCEASKGWEGRIAGKVGIAAGGGLIGGWMHAVLHSGPAQRWAIASAASCVICIGTFAVLQELATRIRCNTGPANSFFAGGTAAYVLSSIQFRSPQKASAIALAAAGGAALADVTFTALDLPAVLRQMLIQADLLDQWKGEEEKPSPKRQFTPEELNEPWQSMAYHHTGTWRDYLPVRKLSEEEWELYQEKKARRFQERIDKITKPRDKD